ncbi:MAG TPA: MFS transporter [Steroidobacteraceae bacterium]|jgi:AAHS family 4-hydroxybenzoate transporter-like MFS transporter
MSKTLDVTQVINQQPVSRFLFGVLALCLLVTVLDGYNITVVSFAAPAIVKAWHLNRAALGPLFSSSLIAGLIGPFLFGVLGDRAGRRTAMIVSIIVIGAFGVASGYCTSLVALIAVRFLAGIGMSGALAVTVATVSEFAPRRLRATFVTIVFSGTTIGSGLPGVIAPPLLNHFGWQFLFLLGGALPLVLAAAVAVFLPESPKFLCLKPNRHAELASVLHRLDPKLNAPADAQYLLGEEAQGSGGRSASPLRLFAGKLAVLTPLLWVGSFVAMVVFHSFNTWLPTLLTDAGVPFSRASLTVALFQFVGTIGGWSIMRPLDRFGMIPCTVLYVLAIPLVLALGLPGNSQSVLLFIIPIAGFCILGLHFAQVACVSSVYPTAVRGLGVGWFMLFARAGGAIGPSIVGVLVGRHYSMSSLFDLAAVPLAIGTVASVAVTILYQANYHRRPDAMSAPPLAQTDPV